MAAAKLTVASDCSHGATEHAEKGQKPCVLCVPVGRIPLNHGTTRITIFLPSLCPALLGGERGERPSRAALQPGRPADPSAAGFRRPTSLGQFFEGGGGNGALNRSHKFLVKDDRDENYNLSFPFGTARSGKPVAGRAASVPGGPGRRRARGLCPRSPQRPHHRGRDLVPGRQPPPAQR